MKKENIKNIYNTLETICNRNTTEEFELGLFLYMRYGCVLDELDNKDLERINSIIQNSETLFNDYILEQTDEIVNAKEEY